MIVIKNNLIPFGTYVAMTVGPFIFTKLDELDDQTLNHEAIHWEQYKELLIVFFPLVYGLMFLWELVRCAFDTSRGTRADGRHRSTWKRAYRSMVLEREAYANDRDMDYISTRKHYAWVKTT